VVEKEVLRESLRSLRLCGLSAEASAKADVSLWGWFCFFDVEAVADAADGLDHLFTPVAQLGAQPADMDINGAGAAEVFVAPDVAEQHRASKNPPGSQQDSRAIHILLE